MGRVRRARIYRDASGQWRYSVKAGNGRVVAASEEGFRNRSTAERRVEKIYPDATVTIEED